jgi:hypothetical protein
MTMPKEWKYCLECLFRDSGVLQSSDQKWGDRQFGKVENMEQSSTAMDINESLNRMNTTESATEVELQERYSINDTGSNIHQSVDHRLTT